MDSATRQKPLSDFPQGTIVRIEAYTGGARSRGRLCALGLVPGTTVKVSGNGGGGCRVSVRESELVLGCGLAEKVLATPVCPARELD